MAATFTATGSSGTYLYPPQLGTSGAGTGAKTLTGLLSLGNPYATNGVAVTAATFLSTATTIVDIIIEGCSADGTIQARLNAAKTKILAYNQAGNEIANATDLSGAGKSLRCMVVVY